MKEKMPLVTSDDYGKDEASAKALLSRHNRLEGEIKAFGSEIKRLDELTQLMTKAASEHNVSPSWLQGWITFFMLSSVENKLILLINVKMTTIVGILTFMCRVNYKLC